MSIIIDITTTFYQPQFKTGICRTERILAWELNKQFKDAKFVIWRNQSLDFIEALPVFDNDGKIISITESENIDDPFKQIESNQVFIAGSAWMNNSRYASALVLEAKSNGLELNLMVYDLIPWRSPDWLEEGYSDIWISNFTLLSSVISRFFVYSDTVKKDLEEFISTCRINKKENIHRILLGNTQKIIYPDDIQTQFNEKTNTFSEIKYDELFLSNFEFCLVVGGIHPRKNYFLLYQVWKELVELNPHRIPLLVIVGGVRWKGEYLDKLFKSDQKISLYYMNLENISDEKLIRLYKKANCSLYPSLMEGWGLPIEESLLNGTPCIASDIPSIREINDLHSGIVTLIDADNPKAWAEEILRLSNPQYLEYKKSTVLAARKIRPWEMTCNQIKNAINTETTKNGIPVFHLPKITKTLSVRELISLIAVIENGWARPISNNNLYCHGVIQFKFKLLNQLAQKRLLIISISKINIHKGKPCFIQVDQEKRPVRNYEVYHDKQMAFEIESDQQEFEMQVDSNNNNLVISFSVESLECKNTSTKNDAVNFILNRLSERKEEVDSINSLGLSSAKLTVKKTNFAKNVYYSRALTEEFTRDEQVEGILLYSPVNFLALQSKFGIQKNKKFVLNLRSNLDHIAIGNRPIIGALRVSTTDGQERELFFGQTIGELENKSLEFVSDTSNLLVKLENIFHISPDWINVSRDIFLNNKAQIFAPIENRNLITNNRTKSILPWSGNLILFEGWAALEKNLVWGNQLSSSIRIFKGKFRKNKLILFVSSTSFKKPSLLRKCIFKTRSQTKQKVLTSRKSIISLDISWSNKKEDKWQDVVINIDSLFSPIESGFNNDGRKLGILLYYAILI